MRAGFLPSTRSTVNRNRLVFGWNGQPYADNIANPGQAGDIFHYLGRAYGRSAWANPAGTSRLNIVVSGNFGSYGATTVLTNRTAATSTASTNWVSADSAGSWVGFQTEYPFIPSGFVFQTASATAVPAYPRNFRFVGTSDVSSAFNSSTVVSDWIALADYPNQTQVAAELTAYYFAVPGNFPLRRLALLSTGLNSGGSNYLALGEIFLFGELLL